MVLVLACVEDEWTFSCLHSWKINCAIGWVCIWTQLFTCLHKSFILKIISLITRLLQLERIRKSGLMLPIQLRENYNWIDLFRLLFCRDTGMSLLMLQIRILLFWQHMIQTILFPQFGEVWWVVVGGTLSCIGQSLISNWGSTPFQNVFIFSF